MGTQQQLEYTDGVAKAKAGNVQARVIKAGHAWGVTLPGNKRLEIHIDQIARCPDGQLGALVVLAVSGGWRFE